MPELNPSSNKKPLLAVLHGEALSPPPIWLMRQAGRFLPEYRLMRQQAPHLLELFLDPVRAAEITLQPLNRFALDAAIIFADILLVPYGLGLPIQFGDVGVNGLNKTGVQASAEQLERIRYDPEGAAQRWQPVMQALSLVSQALPPHATLLGFAGAPWTIAYYLQQRQSDNAKPVSDGLLELLVTATVDYLCLQIDAGAQAVQLFDSWAGLARDDYQRLVIQPHQQIVAGVRARHPNYPIIGFPKGSGEDFVRYANQVPVNAISLDHELDLASILPQLPAKMVVQGNLDPELLRQGGQAMAKAVGDIRQALANRPHIFNLGHGVLPDTPVEHVAQLIQLVKAS
jgi:uroporphyrinogen decarboxylase